LGKSNRPAGMCGSFGMLPWAASIDLFCVCDAAHDLKSKEGPPLRTALPLSGRGPVAQANVRLARVSPVAD